MAFFMTYALPGHPKLPAGQPISRGDDDPTARLRDFEAFKIFDKPPLDTQMWDNASLSFVSRPAPIWINRVDIDIFGDPAFGPVLLLTQGEQDDIRALLERVLGRELLRGDTEGTGV